MADYDVGYKKPPKHTQFQKGHSGNRRGRPKGAKDLRTDLLEELQETIVVREGGKQRKLAKQRAFVKRLCNNPLDGDMRAVSQLANLILRIVEPTEQVDQQAEVSEDDKEILGRFAKRLREPTS